MEIEVLVADLSNPQHAADLVSLLNDYAMDPMGGAEPLDTEVKENLANELAKVPRAFSVICYVNGQAAGLINCFEAFSTFKCKPLINIHDVTVSKAYRGLGISHRMLKKVEAIAAERGCCKITLEVLEGNEAAKISYEKFGFSGYELDPTIGKAMFWQKSVG